MPIRYNFRGSFQEHHLEEWNMENIVAQNLKRLRIAKKLTQEQAAEKLGVSAQSVSRWECGGSQT